MGRIPSDLTIKISDEISSSLSYIDFDPMLRKRALILFARSGWRGTTTNLTDGKSFFIKLKESKIILSSPSWVDAARKYGCSKNFLKLSGSDLLKSNPWSNLTEPVT